MQKRNLLLTGLILLLSMGMLQGQRWKEMWLDEADQYSFFEIQAEFNTYFETHDKAGGNGYKQFKRWEYYMAPRIGKDGAISNPHAETWKNYREYVAKQVFDPGNKTSSSNGTWSYFGSEEAEFSNNGRSAGNGRVNCIGFHPTNTNIIYVGAPAGGLWKTTNGGNTWQPLTDGIAFWGVSGIVVHPTNPNHLYILTGDGDGNSSTSAGVWESFDAGNTWSPTGLNIDYTTNQRRGHKLMMDPSNSNILYAAMRDGLYKTQNGGTTWTQMIAGTIYDMEFRPQNSQTIYISSVSSILRSTNGGTNWTTINSISGADRVAIAVSPANANYLYAIAGPALGVGSFKGVYRSVNGGTSWTTRSTTPNILGGSTTGQDSRTQSWYDLAIAVSPTNINQVFIGGINTWRSNNGGQTWANTSHWVYSPTQNLNYVHADIHAMEYQGNTLFVGCDGGIFRTTNQGGDFTDLSKGLAITEFYRLAGTPQNSNLILGGSQDNGTNRMEAPIPDLSMVQVFGGDGMEAAIDPTNASTYYVTTQGGGLRRTLNGGASFSNIFPSNLGAGNWVTPFVLHPSVPTTLLAGYTDVGESTNQGSSWTNLSNGALGTIRCNQVAYAPSNANYIYVVKSNSVWRSSNGGSSWSNITSGLPSQFYTYIAVHPSTPTHIYVTVSGYSGNAKVYRSTNGGNSWTNFSGSNLPNVPVNCIAYEAGSANGVYIGTDAGIYYRDDNSSDWVDFSNGLPFLRVMELEINASANRLRAATYGRSIWESDLFSQDCPVNLTLNGSLSGLDAYAVSNNLTSTNSLTSSADITFSGGNRVTLNPGFSMASGSELKVIMEGCSGVNQRQLNEVTGTYVPRFVDEEEAAASIPLPEDIAFGNYPNPFRSHTWISFELPTASLVNLEVVDLFGKQVAVLLQDDERSAGVHTLIFNGSDLAPGTYVALLKTGEQVTPHKIVVAR